MQRSDAPQEGVLGDILLMAADWGLVGYLLVELNKHVFLKVKEGANSLDIIKDTAGGLPWFDELHQKIRHEYLVIGEVIIAWWGS